MKIEKYLTNKDITLTNDDIDTAKLIKDLQQGMINESEADKRVEEAKKEWEKEYSKNYSALEEKYNDLEKRNADLTSKNSELHLQNVMTREGFKEDQFSEISKLRTSMYAEDDDETAIKNIKEKFKNTYFPEPEKVEQQPVVPNENKINSENKAKEPIKISRNTKIQDLFLK